MQKQDRLRLVGARGKRFFSRVAFHFGMTALYFALIGLESVIGTILWFGLAAALAVSFFFSNASRRNKREFQISSEVIERLPGGTFEELRAAYASRRSREMRKESLLYLFLAAASALWTLILFIGGARPFAWKLGFFGIVPFLLLVSLALLIGSLLKRKEGRLPTIDAYLQDPERRQIMILRGERQDRRETDAPIAIVTDREPLRSDVERLVAEQMKREKRSAGKIVAYIFAFVFFIVIPNAGLLFTLPLLFSDEFSFLPILFALVCVPCDVALAAIVRSEKRNKRKRNREKQLLNGAYTLEKDRILSAIRSENTAYTTEVCFDREGTFVVTGPDLQKLLLTKPYPDALLLTDENRILGIVFTKRETEKPEEPADDPVRVMNAQQPVAVSQTQAEKDPDRERNRTQDDLMLTDEQVRERAAMRLLTMDPATRAEWENEIILQRETAERLAKKPHDTWTSADETEFHDTLSTTLRRERPMDLQTDSIEKQVMKSLHVTRTEIVQMKRNPYVPGFLIALAIALVAGVGGNVGAALIAKHTGANMTLLYVIASAVSGLFALRLAERLLSIFRFRKLQRQYRKPAFWQRLIDAEAYSMLYQKIKAERETAKQENGSAACASENEAQN